MSEPQNEVCRITAVINRDFLPRSPVSIASDFGVDPMNLVTGRAAMLGEDRGIISKLISKGDRIISRPVDIIHFFVQKSLEEQALQLVAEKFKLNISGSGSVYSETLTVLKDRGGLKLCCNTLAEPTEKNRMQNQLTGICCIVLRGEGDLVARVALETGSCVPTITFAKGAGLRDRLGLWRIAIPAEKEIVTMIVNSYEAEEIMNIIIDAAGLDHPGRGFVYLFPVHRGLINMKVSAESRSEAASMEQVILALDEIKGGTEWRRRRLSSAQTDARRRYLTNLSEFALFCDEGDGGEYVKIALAVGASGATINEYRYVNSKGDEAEISPAREKCSMIVSREQITGIMNALESSDAFKTGKHNDAFIRPVLKAFSYVASR